MPWPAITPGEKLINERAQFQRTPNIGFTRKLFTPTEIEKHPELQRSMRPFEATAFRGALDVRQQRMQQEKIRQLYETAVLPSIDELPVADNMKSILKASIIQAGPKVALDYLEAIDTNDTRMAIQILKNASEQLKQTGGQYEAPQVTGGAGGFPKGTVTQKGPKGKVSVLHKVTQPKPKAPRGVEDVRKDYQTWIEAGNSIERGEVSGGMLAVLEALRPGTIDAYGEAKETKDVNPLRKLVQEQIEILQKQLQDYEMREKYPEAKKDEYGWYRIVNGKKEYARFE